MAQPTPFDRQSSFTLLAQQNPAEPYTGADLDAEFNAVKVTLDEVLANLEMIQRDDGDLANQAVGPDQLAASIDIGINSPSAWAALTAYGQYDTAFNGTSLYKATAAHTSGTVFATDLAAGKWDLLADFNVVSIADGSITTAKLASAAVTSAKLATGAVTQTKLAADAVVTDKILDANVTTAKLATNAVSTAKIQDAAVTTDKIVGEAVTLAKMATIAAGTLLGRLSGGTGAPVANTVTAVTAALDALVGDSGAGGTKGLVPAPGAGDAAAVKFLKADGTWASPAAAQSDQETGTSTVLFVTPGRQQFHPSAAKCWAYVTYSGGTPTLASPSHNITSITDTATGRLTITIATDFSDANYSWVAASNQLAGSDFMSTCATAQAAGSIVLETSLRSAKNDPPSISFQAFGDQ